MIYRGDNYHCCLECKCAINFGDTVTQGKWGYYCGQCSERKPMPNIKITAEVDGKQVPLETVSTETFEAIKALEKPKEIPVPVARIGHYKDSPSGRRLFLKLTDSVRANAANGDIDVIAINLQHGAVNNTWIEDNDTNSLKLYENVKPL